MPVATAKSTILIVDDIPDNIQVISNILYQKGVNIAIAQSGQEALSLTRKRLPDLILLDVMMPDMDGFEVCQRLKAEPVTREIPVIFLTARVQTDDVLKGFEYGAVDYITKPFNPAELISRVFTHLELKSARDTITAQNRQLAQQNQELHELNATKDKFFSIIAHDLKNPFNALLSLSALLKDELHHYSPEDVERYIHRIYESAERSYTLLENLLEWARSQTGRLQFDPHPVYLRNLVEDTLKILEAQAQHKQIAVFAEIPEAIVFTADLKMVAAVLRNMVSNAIKFTQPGGDVRVKAEIFNGWVRIAIADSGIGIKPDMLPNLFRIDVHHSTAGTSQERGTGLGLILCKEFVEKHGGTIEVESTIGKGSCFTVRLPATLPSAIAK
jgi:two-component system, sensor histidine kinase and response regulator